MDIATTRVLCDRCHQPVELGLEMSAARHLACSPPIVSAPVRALIGRAADVLEGWVQSESQYDNYEQDPSWMLAQQLRAVLAGKAS